MTTYEVSREHKLLRPIKHGPQKRTRTSSCMAFNQTPLSSRLAVEIARPRQTRSVVVLHPRYEQPGIQAVRDGHRDESAVPLPEPVVDDTLANAKLGEIDHSITSPDGSRRWPWCWPGPPRA